MANPQLNELVDYIKKASQAGQTEQQTRQILSKNGWSEAEVQEAFQQIQPQQQVQQTQQVQPQVAAIQQQPQYKPVENKKNRLIIILCVIFFITSIVAFSLVLATKIWDPAWNPFGPSPETIILKAWENFAQIKTENFNSELSVIGNDINVNLLVNGKMDNSDLQNKLASAQVSLDATATYETENNYNLYLTGEVRMIGESLYVIINDFDLGGLEEFLVMFFGIDANSLRDQWIKFDAKDFYSSLPVDQQTEAEKDAQEAQNKIVKILLDKKVYNIKKLPDNQGSAGPEHHFSVSLNRAKFNTVLPEILEILQEYVNKYSVDNFTSPNPNIKEINDALDKVGDLSVDLFIGKKDNRFYKMQINKDADVKINFKLEWSDINQPVQITAPENYKTFEEFREPLMRTQQIKNDLMQISYIAQSYFNTSKSYYYFCRNGYLNGYLKTYGTELADISKDIVAQKAKWPNCFSNIQNFCISAQLEDGSWLCIDKNSYYAGTTKCTSAITVCQ